jgi:hypothetical protein
MTTYWVKYDISISVDPSTVQEPVPPDLTFLGVDLFNNPNAITGIVDPILDNHAEVPFELFFSPTCCWEKVAKAVSRSLSFLAFATTSCRPKLRAAG